MSSRSTAGLKRVVPDPASLLMLVSAVPARTGSLVSSCQKQVPTYWPAMLPLAGALLVQIAYHGMVAAFLDCRLAWVFQARCEVPSFALADLGRAGDVAAVAREMGARLAWLTTVVFLIAVCLAVWMTSCRWVYRCLEHWTRRDRIILLGVALVLGALLADSRIGGVQSVLLKQMFPDGSTAFPRQVVQTVGALPLLCRLMSIAAVTVGFAACATIVVSCREHEDARKLSESMKRLQHVLFAGALLLIAAILQFRTFFTWAAASGSTENVDVVTQVGSTAAATLGAVYAVILAVLYFPAALILTARARRLALDTLSCAAEGGRTAVSTPDVDDWLQKNGLVFSTPKSLSTFAAVLGPLLAQAPTAALLELLK